MKCQKLIKFLMVKDLKNKLVLECYLVQIVKD